MLNDNSQISISNPAINIYSWSTRGISLIALTLSTNQLYNKTGYVAGYIITSTCGQAKITIKVKNLYSTILYVLLGLILC